MRPVALDKNDSESVCKRGDPRRVREEVRTETALHLDQEHLDVVGCSHFVRWEPSLSFVHVTPQERDIVTRGVPVDQDSTLRPRAVDEIGTEGERVPSEPLRF